MIIVYKRVSICDIITGLVSHDTSACATLVLHQHLYDKFRLSKLINSVDI